MSGWADYGFDDAITLRPFMTAAEGIRAAARDCERFGSLDTSQDRLLAFGQRTPLKTDDYTRCSVPPYQGENMQMWQLCFDYTVSRHLNGAPFDDGVFTPRFVSPATFGQNPVGWGWLTWLGAVDAVTGSSRDLWLPTPEFYVDQQALPRVHYDYTSHQANILKPSGSREWALQRRRLLDMLHLKGYDISPSSAGDYHSYDCLHVRTAAYTTNPPGDGLVHEVDMRRASWWRTDYSEGAYQSVGCFSISYDRTFAGSDAQAALFLEPITDLKPFGCPFFSQGWNVVQVPSSGAILDEAMADAVGGAADNWNATVSRIKVVEDLNPILTFKAS